MSDLHALKPKKLLETVETDKFLARKLGFSS